MFRSIARDRLSAGRRLLLLFLVVSAAGAGPGLAQTRAGTIADEQAEKARNLTPQVPSRYERLANRIFAGFTDPQGVSATLDGVYSGGWIGAGPIYRHALGERTTFMARGLYTIHQYPMVEATVVSRGLALDRLDILAHARWFEATRVSFYGLGAETLKDAKAHYGFARTDLGAGLAFRPAPPFRLNLGVAYEDYATRSPQGGAPAADDVFDETTAPGLGAEPRYVRATFGGALDWRPATGYARTGGSYGLELHAYEDTRGPWDFSRLDVDLIQHVPLFNEALALSFRGRLQTTVSGEDRVPYFVMPYVGGSRVLRGFSSRRFTGPHTLAFSAEYRWMPHFRFLDLALFYDAGMAALSRSDLSLSRLESSVGIGVRLHTIVQTPLRLDVGHSREGWRFTFATTAAF